MVVQIIASMIGTVAFAILFHVPRREYVFCAMNGALGWAAYLLLRQWSVGLTISTLGAALILTIAARTLSTIRRCPVTVFLVTGIFTLVPGARIYYTAYYLLMNDLGQFTIQGVEAFKIAGAIVLGIVFGFTISQNWFNRLGRKEKYVGK